MVTISDPYFKTCEPYKKEIYSKGIWFGEDPTERVFSIVMLQIILMFLFSRLRYFVLRPLKQPRFICNLLVSIFSNSFFYIAYIRFLNNLIFQLCKN